MAGPLARGTLGHNGRRPWHTGPPQAEKILRIGVVVVGDCALGFGALGLSAQCGLGSAHWGPRLGARWRTGLFAFGSRAQGPPQAEIFLRIREVVVGNWEVVVGNCALGRWGRRPLRIGVAGPKAPAHWALCCAHPPGVSNSRY